MTARSAQDWYDKVVVRPLIAVAKKGVMVSNELEVPAKPGGSVAWIVAADWWMEESEYKIKEMYSFHL
jgi:hypothetical protein